jgi:hypothetical protein
MQAYLPIGVAPYPSNPRRNRYRRVAIIRIFGGNELQDLAWLRVQQT